MAGNQQQGTRTFGAKDYREGALERMAEASHLLRGEAFAGSVYLAGRGVEGMLRAVIWHNDSEIRGGRQVLETGHDLLELLKRVANLGLLKEADRDDDFRIRVQRVARLWFNNMRFASAQKVEQDWRRSRDVHGRRTLKRAAGAFYDSCSVITKRCEALL